MLEIIVISIYTFLLTLILVYCILEFGLAWNYVKFRKDYLSKRQKHLHLNEKTPQSLPFVTIQLPVFNEKYVVERLIDSIAAFNYPKDRFEIQVLDDSTDDTVKISRKKVEEYREKGFNISLIHRVDRSGFKAGALQKGMLACKGEFIAIFDADFLPNPNFLQYTVPYFEDKNVGVVQTRWQHINHNYSFLTRIQAFFLDAHFTVEQVGRNAAGCFINFNGTAGIWRKKTIEDAGGWQSDTLTEDLDLSYRSQMKGWNFVYLEDVLSPAELPADIQSFKSQQFRWIKGGAETALKILPKVLDSNLSFKVKLNAFIHLLSSSIYLVVFCLVIMSVPLLLVKDAFFVNGYLQYAAIFLFSNVAIGIFYAIAVRNKNSVTKGFWNYCLMLPAFLILTMGLSLHNSLAVIRAYLGEKTPFIRTPKFNLQDKKDTWVKKSYLQTKIDTVTLIEGLITFYFLGAIIYGVLQQDFSLMLVHVMAFLGFGSVFIYSVSHILRSR